MFSKKCKWVPNLPFLVAQLTVPNFEKNKLLKDIWTVHPKFVNLKFDWNLTNFKVKLEFYFFSHLKELKNGKHFIFLKLILWQLTTSIMQSHLCPLPLSLLSITHHHSSSHHPHQLKSPLVPPCHCYHQNHNGNKLMRFGKMRLKDLSSSWCENQRGRNLSSFRSNHV